MRASSLPQHRTLQGCMRLHGSPISCKRALTLDDLAVVIGHTDHSSYNDCLFLSMILTGFFALLRLGEMIFPDDKSLHNWRKIARRSSVSTSDISYQFLLLCQHPDPYGESAKKKPTPYHNHFVAVHGFITDVVPKDGTPDSDPVIGRFKITVDSLEFLGAEPSSSSGGINLIQHLLPPRLKGFTKFKGKSVACKTPSTPCTPTPAEASSSGSKRDREENEQPNDFPAAIKPKKAAMTTRRVTASNQVQPEASGSSSDIYA